MYYKKRECEIVAEKFLYNRETTKLHIMGYCPNSNHTADGIVFNSENEALAYDDRAVSV